MTDMSENGILSRVLRVTLEVPDGTSARVPASLTPLPDVAQVRGACSLERLGQCTLMYVVQ